VAAGTVPNRYANGIAEMVSTIILHKPASVTADRLDPDLNGALATNVISPSGGPIKANTATTARSRSKRVR